MSIAFNHQLYPGCVFGVGLTKYNSVRNYRVVRTEVICRKEQLYINVIVPQMIGF